MTEIDVSRPAERFEGPEHERVVREELRAAVTRYACCKGVRRWELKWDAVTRRGHDGVMIVRYPVGYFVTISFHGDANDMVTQVHDRLIDALRHALSWMEEKVCEEQALLVRGNGQ